ncbi:MAG: AsmA family protein [Burkholderiaceae bacterium]
MTPPSALSLWLRRALLALGVVVLLLVAAGAWYARGFDAAAVKGVAIDWMQTHRQRTLAIDGPVELALWPRLAVKVARVSLSEVGGAPGFASIDEASFAVALWPLLRGEVAIGRVDARGVRLTLLRDARGRRNIDDLLAPEAVSSASGPASAPVTPDGRPLRLNVSGVALADVRVRVKDAQAGIDGEVLVKELETGRIASGVESKVRLAAQLVLRAPAIHGDVGGTARLTPDLEAGLLRLADMDLVFKGDVPGASAVEARVQGGLGWGFANGAIDAQALRVALDANAAGFKLAGSTLAIDRFAYDPQRKTLAIKDLALRLRGSQATQPLEVDLDWPALDVQANALTGSALSGKTTRGGALPLAATFRSGAPSGSFNAVRIPAFEAVLRSDSAARKLGATLRADLVLDPQRKSLALDALDLKATVAESGLPPIALALTGKASAAPQAVGWALAGQVNGQRLGIDGQADLSGAVPNIKAQARFDALDLNAFLPSPPPLAAPAKSGADVPLDLSGLRAIDGNFSLRAESLAVRQVRITDARLDATLDAGMLRVSRLQGRVWGGSVDGSAFADARASRVSVKAVASGVDVNALLRDVAQKDLLEGSGRVTVDLDSAGRSTAELKSRLRGTAELQLRDGAVKGINLAQRLRQARAALTQRADHEVKANRTEKTDFSTLSASFRIADGVARSTDLDVKSPFLRLGGEGSADIGKGRIDYTVRATVTDTLKGQDGADLAALRGLTVPVRLAGPFDAIDWQIQWSGVATALLRNQLEDKLRDRLGLKPPAAAPDGRPAAPKDVLRDTLKGLFR